MEGSGDTYFSVAAISRATFRDRASRFIGVVYPVNSEAEVKNYLDAIKKDYHDANHHCFAYALGKENQKFRFSDDGEPAGSAGKPIYGQILSKGISDVLVVVIRYFGGTKLGVPGLINAYRTAAREALEAGTVVEKVITERYLIRFSYDQMNQVMRILKQQYAGFITQSFENECMIVFDIRKGSAKAAVDKLRGHIKVYELINESQTT